MNLRIFFPIIGVASLIVAAGCSKSSKLNVPSTSPAPAGPVELKLKWTPGERIVEEFDMDQDMLINFPKQPEPIHQETTFGQKFLLKVLDANADGGHDLEMEFQAVHLSSKAGDKTNLDYDSEKDSASSVTNSIAKTFGKIVGAKIKYVLDQSNNVADVQGVEDLSRRLQPSRANAAIFKRTFNKDYFRQIMEGSRFLPPDPVQPGDTWPVKLAEPSDATGTINLNFVFTFKGWEMHGPRNCARVDFTGTMESEPGETPGPTGMTISVQNGTATGVYWFDPEYGMPIDSNIKEDMLLLIALPKRAQAQVGAAVLTNNLSQVITFKVDSLN